MGRGHKGKASFIKSITGAVLGYLLLMVVMLLAVWWNTARTMEYNAGETLSQARFLSSYKIEEVLKSNEQALSTVLQDNDNIRTFEYGGENQRAIAAQNTLQIIKKAALASADVETLFFYDLIGDTYIVRPGGNLSYYEIQQIEQTVRKISEDNPSNMPPAWFYQRIGDKDYLVRIYKNKKRMLGALVDVSQLFSLSASDSRVTFTLADTSGQIIESFGNAEAPSPDDISGAFNYSEGWSADGAFYIMGEKSDMGDFGLFASLTRKQVYGNFQLLQAVIFLLVIAAIIMLISISIYARKRFYAPFAELIGAMKKIESGEQGVRLSDNADTEEFQQINSSFNQMMDTIVNLRMKSYEERIQFDEATLKYVQLQIKPHFFLNALTTIHSMSLQSRDEDIRDYIERLSRNVRYLFKSGLHTVPLSEELEHARDYIAMQEILYPGSVFDFIECDEEIGEYPVPQLVVHTILENIYKHAVSMDKLTSVIISARLEKRDGEEMCHIAVEDDGEGYPEQFLDNVRQGKENIKESGHGVGLWNLKKTLSLMYRRDDLIEFSNRQPHGARVDMWIPRRVKRQSSVWKLS